MALVFLGKTQCSICDVVIQNSDEWISTSHFIGDQNDPLWRFSDSAMHKSCFRSWERRRDFISRYNETAGKITSGDGTYHHMEDMDVFRYSKRNTARKS